MPVPTVRLPSNDTVAAACVLLITTFAAFTVLWKSAPLLLVTVTVPMSVPTGPPTVTAPVALNATFDGVDPPTRFAPVIEPVPMVEPAKVSVSLSAMVMLPVETVPPLTAPVALNATFDGVDPPTRFAPVIEPVPMVEPAKVSVSLSAMVMLPVETVPPLTAPVALNATFDGVDPPTRFAPVIEPVPMVEPAKVSVSLSAMVMLPVETVPPLTASVVPSALSELVVTPPAVAFNVPVRLVAPNCRLPAVAVVVPAIVVAPPAVCVAPLANVVAPLRVTVPVSLNTVAPAPAMLLVVPRIDTR